MGRHELGTICHCAGKACWLYDFFWRLHVTDYSDGEDFNSPLLRVAALAAVALVTTADPSTPGPRSPR